MFILAFVSVMLAGDFVWLWRCRRWMRHAGWGGKIAVTSFTVAQTTGLLLVLFLRGRLHELQFPLSTPVLASIYLWHFLFIIPMMLLWLPLVLGKAVALAARAIVGMKHAPTAEAAPAMPRRDFFRLAGCAAPALFTIGLTKYSLAQLQHFRIRTLEVPIAALPPALDGLTIAHVSDLHVGQFTRGAILDEIVAATNALRADLVLSTGDLINFDLKDLPAGISVITRLEAPFGVFMCEGNHDLFEDPDAFRRRTRDAGIRLLVNENAVLNIRGTAVQILGLPWGAGVGNPHDDANRGDRAIEHSTRLLLQQRQAGAFPIILAHHPHAFDYAEDSPLTLAGHTHGGQLMATEDLGCGPMIFRYWSGLYRKSDRAMVVSNGVGNWFPLRTRAPAEIVHLTLRRT